MNGNQTMTIGLCLATSLDGKIAERPGSAPGFTSRFDREKLFQLRAQADVLLIGANTVRQEGLAPLIRNPKWLADRKKQGLKPHPDIVLVSASMNLPWDSEYFKNDKQSISILTGTASAKIASDASKAGVSILNTGPVLDLAEGMRQLSKLGYRQLLCEGGGTLVAGMLAANLVDQIHLTLAPTFIGGANTPSLVNGPLLVPRPQFDLVEVSPVQSELHLIYQKHHR